jgi:hypothetical protein
MLWAATATATRGTHEKALWPERFTGSWLAYPAYRIISASIELSLMPASDAAVTKATCEIKMAVHHFQCTVVSIFIAFALFSIDALLQKALQVL